MASDTIDLRDLVGPYRGQVRTYRRHAGENAISHGFAERLDAPAERQLSPTKQRRYSGAEKAPPAPAPEVTATALPEEFPGRDDLLAFGHETVESVPRTFEELVSLPGIGKVTARQILEALGVEAGE